jgi:hypothetical protein
VFVVVIKQIVIETMTSLILFLSNSQMMYRLFETNKFPQQSHVASLKKM